ncbi:hypothetical protein E2562_039370 [Oryza meyeriana var. granulata]|uniref:Uncharacterized protein n=1 Tax=Oryza meyeriana var. granulata TaxID=110450 RepID=A0A6G1EUD1_9ORYZ|nr:hypothetical protein E2562_039370 [Oryza meyeriana var. granulata]
MGDIDVGGRIGSAVAVDSRELGRLARRLRGGVGPEARDLARKPRSGASFGCLEAVVADEEPSSPSSPAPHPVSPPAARHQLAMVALLKLEKVQRVLSLMGSHGLSGCGSGSS